MEGIPILMQRLNLKRLGLYKLFSALDLKTGCEIGVAEGGNAKVICDTIENVKLFGIDHWLRSSYYESMLRRLDSYIKGNGFVPVKKTSLEAVDDFADESLDFVYIDADHSYEHVKQDIEIWSKKVRNGGIVSGHDYYVHSGTDVIKAVTEYIKGTDIDLFVLADEPGKWLHHIAISFFWIK